jgi:hypothetical protein
VRPFAFPECLSILTRNIGHTTLATLSPHCANSPPSACATSHSRISVTTCSRIRAEYSKHPNHFTTASGVTPFSAVPIRALISWRQSVRRNARQGAQSSRSPRRHLAHIRRHCARRAQHLACACDMEPFWCPRCVRCLAECAGRGAPACRYGPRTTRRGSDGTPKLYYYTETRS